MFAHAPSCPSPGGTAMDCRVFKLARCRAKISTRADRQRSERADQPDRHKEARGERAARRYADVYVYSTGRWQGTILLHISNDIGIEVIERGSRNRPVALPFYSSDLQRTTHGSDRQRHRGITYGGW